VDASHQEGIVSTTRTRHARRTAAAGAVVAATTVFGTAYAFAAPSTAAPSAPAAHTRAATPIDHLVVIFGENISFDHYFGTYPQAANTDGQKFVARPGTPSVNGLTPALLTHNPNSVQPKRLTSSQVVTCDMNHGYTAEQKAFDGGLMDAFVQNTDAPDCTKGGTVNPGTSYAPGMVMDYYDGNTVTALWNYAQRYAMSDNSYDTTFGPSSPGALNLVSGQTHGVYSVDPLTGQKTAAPDGYTVVSPNASGIGTVINDPDPAWDDCSTTKFARAAMTGTNVGDLLNAKGVTWGWFQGGFRPTTYSGTSYDGKPMAVCGATTKNAIGASVSDYSPHHSPFQYYASTANPHHLPPSGVGMIGRTDQANHQYDLTDFAAALKAGHLPAVTFLKAPMAQDGHAGYSGPADEQTFVVNTINALQKSKDWEHTAVVLAYDDSDGWYDHQMSPILNASADPVKDALNGAGVCGHGTPLGGYADRCGYGPRLPLLVISPYSRTNYVDSTLTDLTSILRFVEDNWLGGQRIGDGSYDAMAGSLNGMFDWHHATDDRLLLDPTTGQPVKH
jgi:phospholipase C